MLNEFKNDKKNLEFILLDLIKEFEKKYSIIVYDIDTLSMSPYSTHKKRIKLLKLKIEL